MELDATWLFHLTGITVRDCMFFNKISDVLSNSWENIWFISASVMTSQLVSYCLFCNRTSQIEGCYERKGIKVSTISF